MVTVVTVDGRADVVDGALIGLYVIIAAIFWWVSIHMSATLGNVCSRGPDPRLSLDTSSRTRKPAMSLLALIAKFENDS